MQVQIKHDGVNISEYCVSYEREHKICTGIGQLELTLSLTYPTAINPWDTMDVYENGSFQVRYYVSSVSKSQPDGTITLECQDKSKRLVDYFIPDQYTIDYPSYTRYWIEKFLDEAGITYNFTTSDIGKLLSNNTTMGLTPAYEQIMTLLQLSGWYMYFDGNGVAIIGTLTTDLGNPSDRFTKNDILEISLTNDDKMLRNRAVVWGAFNPASNDYAFADVSTITRWNYDSRDLRTMVVSNGNIPNISSAYGIANMLLKEFARITEEKRLAVAGLTNCNLGDAVSVRSNVYNGLGLVTTFGVSMSKSGLITNLILDERCPRLFGFFDFGDYVYVGTYGDGVWRKHIKYDNTFYDFSAGLTDLAVTDLHINNGVFGAITASGGMFYSEDSVGPWTPYLITSLTSSLEDEVQLGSEGAFPSGIVMTSFSGLMGRATIVDKLKNTVKYGIDTYSGVNYGDYFLTYSGILAANSGVMSSGVVPSGITTSGYRGWIVEYNVFTMESGVYPISVSGNFDIQVLDLENDGLNDYVSVRTAGNSIPSDGIAFNYGWHTNQPFAITADSQGYSVTPENIGNVENNLDGNASFSQAIRYSNSLLVYDNQIAGETETITAGITSGTRRYLRTRVIRTVTDNSTTSLSTSSLTSPATDAGNVSYPFLGGIKISTNVYRFYYYFTSFGNVKVYYDEWDANSNTVTTSTLISDVDVQTYSSGDIRAWGVSVIVVNGVGYILHYGQDGPNQTSNFSTPGYFLVNLFRVDMEAATVAPAQIAKFDYPAGPDSENILEDGKYYFSGSSTYLGNGIMETAFASLPFANLSLYQDGPDSVKISGFLHLHLTEQPDPFAAVYNNYVKEYIITGDTTSVSYSETFSNGPVTNDVAERMWNIDQASFIQLTANKGVIPFTATTVDGVESFALATGGIDLTSFGVTPLPEQLTYSMVYPILTTGDSYVTRKADETWYLSNAVSFELGAQIVPPTGYEILQVYSSALHSWGDSVYVACFDSNRTPRGVLVPFTSAGNFEVSRELRMGVSIFGTTKGLNIGGFFICEPSDYTQPTAAARITYIDMLVPYSNDGSYLVLQRDETDFHIIQQSGKPIRVDISNSSPLVTVLDNDNTFRSHYIFNNEIMTFYGSPNYTGITQPSGVRDYRYTMLEIPSGITISGVFTTMSGLETSSGVDGANKLILYAMGSGINFTYTNDLSSGYLPIYAMPSGLAERIETSNFVASGQYVFVTTSGDSPAFYQKDPMSAELIYYSGLPVSRATIIRLDDRV